MLDFAALVHSCAKKFMQWISARKRNLLVSRRKGTSAVIALVGRFESASGADECEGAARRRRYRIYS